MRTYLTLLLLLLLTVSAGVDAQYYPGNYIGAGTWVANVTDGATVTTVWNNPGDIHGIIMGAKNRTLVCSPRDLDAVVRVDPTTGTVTTILYDAANLASPGGLVIDQDGNLIVASQTSGGVHGLYKLTGSTLTTVCTTLGLGVTANFTGGLVRDVDTGDYVVQAFDVASGHPMYKIAADGSSFTTVHTGISGYPKRDFTQEVASGNYYVGSSDTTLGGILIEVTPAGLTTIKANVVGNNNAFSAPVADRASAAAPRIMSNHYNTATYYVDVATGTVTTMAMTVNSVSPKCGTILYSRNIQTVLTAPGKWDINVSFPTLPSKVYALVATLSGIRPGFNMGDGRRILLNPDPLTYATLVDALPTIFNDGGNVLDASGEATGKLNLTTLPPLGGLTMHILALAESSPGTIAAISEPFVMRLP